MAMNAMMMQGCMSRGIKTHAPDGVRIATFADCSNGKLGDRSAQHQICFEKLVPVKLSEDER
jgi:hypothetical protein